MNELKSSHAFLTGISGRVSAADEAATVLCSQSAILRATIQVTRAETGKVDEYEVFGTPIADQQTEGSN